MGEEMDAYIESSDGYVLNYLGCGVPCLDDGPELGHLLPLCRRLAAAVHSPCSSTHCCARREWSTGGTSLAAKRPAPAGIWLDLVGGEVGRDRE